MSIETIIQRAKEIRDACINADILSNEIISAIVEAAALDSAASTVDDRLHHIDRSIDRLAAEKG